MEVLSIVCYIISSPSAFILIIFRVAHWKLLYIYIYFSQNVLSLYSTVIVPTTWCIKLAQCLE